MKIQQIQTNISPAFAARCPQIRDADWVCRKVNHFEHISLTKYRKQILDYAVSKGALAEGQSVHALRSLRPIGKRNNNLLKFYEFYKNFAETFSSVRKDWENVVLNDAQATVKMIKQYNDCQMANCGEDAFLAAAITRLNGVENVYTACFTKDKMSLGHQVCIFNKDRSEFDGKIKPFNTIIIDPWIQKADFANLLLKDYKINLRNFIDFDDVDKIKFANKYIYKIDFSNTDISSLKEQYPKLIYPYKNRNFMEIK